MINIKDSSIFLIFYRKISLVIRTYEGWLDRMYRNSGIFLIIEKSPRIMKIYLKFSFLGRLTEAKTNEAARALSESFVSKLFNRNFSWLKNCISDNLSESLIVKALNEFAGMLGSAPMKTLGPLIILFIILNIVLSISLKGHIDLLGWAFRLCFLIVGLIGWTCNTKWKDLKKTSFVLRKLNEKN